MTKPDPLGRTLLREPVILVCGTVIVVAFIAAVVVLVSNGHGMDVDRLVNRAYEGIIALTTLFGVVAKVRSVSDKVTEVHTDVIAANGVGKDDSQATDA